MSGWDFATRCRKVGSMQKYSFETWQEESLRHGVAKYVPYRNVVLRTVRQELYDMISQSGFYAAQKSLRHRVVKSERGDNDLYF